MNLEDGLKSFVRTTNRRIVGSLGFGHDGDIFRTDIRSALKFFNQLEDFERELAVYQRLTDMGIVEILGHEIPRLMHWDERLLVIEMSIVARPFLLDFASAYLDWPPDFSEEVLAEWRERKKREFGKHWPRVEAILSYLGDTCGIYLTDIHRGNIAFEDDDFGSTASSS